MITEIKNKIQEELDDHITTLNEKDEEGDEMFSYYRSELEYGADESEETIADLVENADIDSVDFNIGFEQGYMRGLQVALSHFKEE